jgi:cAMP-dependent protein kinase regulator
MPREMTEDKTSDFGRTDPITHDLVARLVRSGRHAEARLAAAEMLRGNPTDRRALHLLSRALVAAGDDGRACRALRRLAAAYGADGDLPMAIVAALELDEAGSDPREIVEDLSRSYSSTAEGLVDDWRPSPPAIPHRTCLDLSRVPEADALSEAVDSALIAASELAEDAVKQRPFFPLLSSLGPDAFVRFVARLALDRRTAGDVVIEQGTPGESFFIVAQGEVRVERRHADGVTRMLARLGPGAFFGEMAIVTAAPRAARVTAATDVTLLRADMAEVGPEMERTPELQRVLMAFCKARMLENILFASPVLRRVPAPNRSDLIARFSHASHVASEVVIEEGSPSRGLYLIVSGEVDVTHREQGETLSLARLGPGDFFGEISLVLQRPAVATVTAATDTASLFLPGASFLDAVRDHPGLLVELYETAIKREAETASILAREAEDADDLVLL